jgi:hypothetical protein
LTIDGEERPFYDDEDHEKGADESGKDSSSSDGESGGEDADGQKKATRGGGEAKGRKEPSKQKAVMDPDHRLLLKNARPLLQSRNSAVRIHFLHISSFISSHLG